MKVIVVAFISGWDNGGITAGVFLASILLKVEYEPERLLGKLINLLTIPSTFRARIRLFPFARGQP